MKADYKVKNKLRTIVLDVNVSELVLITKGLEIQLNNEKDYLQFYKEELINPTVKCNANEEIEKCNIKIGQLKNMLSKLQS